MFAPGVQDVMIEFNFKSKMIASFIVSVYVLGYTVGPLVVAPLSELYGCVSVYHVSNVLFIIFTIACAVSSSLDMLTVVQFLAGITGSTPLSIGAGTFGDMFKAEE